MATIKSTDENFKTLVKENQTTVAGETLIAKV